jgi:hypothetical protein
MSVTRDRAGNVPSWPASGLAGVSGVAPVSGSSDTAITPLPGPGRHDADRRRERSPPGSVLHAITSHSRFQSSWPRAAFRCLPAAQRRSRSFVAYPCQPASAVFAAVTAQITVPGSSARAPRADFGSLVTLIMPDHGSLGSPIRHTTIITWSRTLRAHLLGLQLALVSCGIVSPPKSPGQDDSCSLRAAIPGPGLDVLQVRQDSQLSAQTGGLQPGTGRRPGRAGAGRSLQLGTQA